MGDIADAMLDGDLCQCCGVYMEGGNGYPQTCGGCQRTFERAGIPSVTPKVKCPTCGKKVRLSGSRIICAMLIHRPAEDQSMRKVFAALFVFYAGFVAGIWVALK